MLDKKLSSEVVKIHLIQFGIDTSYKTWVHHGEAALVRHPRLPNDEEHDHGEGIGDGMGGDMSDNDDQLPEMLEQIYMGGMMNDGVAAADDTGVGIMSNCKTLHEKMVTMRDEANESGTPLTNEEISRAVLGEKNKYLRGFGVGLRPSSFASKSNTESKVERHEAEIVLLHEEREEDQKRRKEDQKRREEERDEERRHREAQQKQIDELRRTLQQFMQGR